MTALVSQPVVVGSAEVHLWRSRLDLRSARLRVLEAHLAANERARAGRFRFARERNRFIAGRGILRELLAGYTGRRPSDIVITYGEYGRPELADGSVVFNLAHSGQTVLYAIGAAAQPVGVDIEQSGAAALADRVPEHFFSAREVAELRALPAADQEQGFLRCWTRKEAYLKAHGTGLALPLNDFAVTLAPDVPPALVWTQWSPDEPSRWRLHDVSRLCPGYVAAVAVGANVDIVVGRRWSPGEEST